MQEITYKISAAFGIRACFAGIFDNDLAVKGRESRQWIRLAAWGLGFRACIGIMEKRMETTIFYRVIYYQAVPREPNTP